MGLYLTFKGKKTKGLFKNISIKHLLKVLTSLSKVYECHVHYYQNENIMIDFCPGGNLYLELKDKVISGEVQTNLVGPGFHKLVVNFLDKLKNCLKLAIEVEDDTTYYQERDFEKLKEEHLSWFKQVMMAFTEIESPNLLVSWPINEWRPVKVKGLVTPMGIFNHNYINSMINSCYASELAKEYFIWFNENKDEYYFRNVAIFQMWNDFAWVKPRTQEEKKLALIILKSLEIAKRMNKEIKLPEAEIEEINYLLGNIEKCEIKRENDPIGYKRDNIIFIFPGNWEAILPGRFISNVEEDGTVTYWDIDKVFRLTSFKVNEKTNLKFTNEMVNECTPNERLVTFETETTKYRGKYSFYQDDNNEYWILNGQIINENQIAIVTITWENHVDTEWALDTFKNVRKGIDKVNMKTI